MSGSRRDHFSHLIATIVPLQGCQSSGICPIVSLCTDFFALIIVVQMGQHDKIHDKMPEIFFPSVSPGACVMRWEFPEESKPVV